jgi:hypothetical protein
VDRRQSKADKRSRQKRRRKRRPGPKTLPTANRQLPTPR